MEQARDLFQGTAEVYQRYRVPYPNEAFDWIVNEFRLDGRGRLLDSGCGTGQVAVPLARWFDEVVAIDPDQDMLRIAERTAREAGVSNVRFLNARAEDVPGTIAPLRLATFGASFHWTDRTAVANRLYDMIEPGGGLVALSPASFWSGREAWHQVVIKTIRHWLGAERRAGAGLFKVGPLHQEYLAQTRFTDIKSVDIRKLHIWTADSIVGYLSSTSFASRAVLGKSWTAFENDLRARLTGHSSEDRFAEEIEISIVSARRS
jgi:ubiquinone/menaquinone biosynthesis C-methylase UbiE